MLVGSAAIGTSSPHQAGLMLLTRLYESRYGQPIPAIRVTPRGKPFFQDSPVHFSISHTKTQVFCVLSDRPVGIDAEDLDRPIRLELAEKILSPTEISYYEQSRDKRDTLLRFWVLKEATAKCSGEGLRGYPNHTDFSPEDSRIRVMDHCYVAIIED